MSSAHEAIAEHGALLAAVEGLLPRVEQAAERMIAAYRGAGRVLAFGNGGSAADAQHLAAELVGRFRRERDALSAVALTVDPSTVTSLGNDFTFTDVFARQVEAHARAGDLVVGFTTSGRSENVLRALRAARARKAGSVVFSGGDGGPAADEADLAIVVPSGSTPRVQEMHVLLLHLVVDRVDAWAAGVRP
jgi:D-sedoheptulose 7-phosphate isomerase